MADTNTGPRNRRERRAAAREAGDHPSSASGTTTALTTQRTPSDIPLAQPDRSGPKGKTLYDLAEERMAELQKQGQPFAKAPAGSDDEDFGPKAEALLWAFSLTMVHLTLDVLVHNQYREEIAWAEVWKRTAVVLPSMWLIIYLFHTKTALKFTLFRQLVYLGIACAGGCYCVYVGNTFGYFAVMKQTPPVGTLWIWSVVEMQKWYALTSIIVVGLYTLWNGYGFF
ncbi:uncharacterized protein K452DRAFT_290403 [Aplosporella prunicola CBS 121167]|uniref:DUF7719 domain-containing protein n=1 Tax=Aplosporella prunicola CBS 121167 TaxID=1176127 RepID=A0A6A6B673_9PEZI|nr:uncharacterized protein K452DRAFT_290403 [Aplosporella prunicola CBS 121167]KAF2138754.1 hypothetical protein K452DRAFT_290403 [Aplosporella prunicola CBS 121167]